MCEALTPPSTPTTLLSFACCSSNVAQRLGSTASERPLNDSGSTGPTRREQTHRLPARGRWKPQTCQRRSASGGDLEISPVRVANALKPKPAQAQREAYRSQVHYAQATNGFQAKDVCPRYEASSPLTESVAVHKKAWRFLSMALMTQLSIR